MIGVFERQPRAQPAPACRGGPPRWRLCLWWHRLSACAPFRLGRRGSLARACPGGDPLSRGGATLPLAALAVLLLPATASLPAVASVRGGLSAASSAQAGVTAVVPQSGTKAGPPIRYSVSVADRADHLFAVTMTVPDVHGRLTVAIPAWNALYQIRDFAARVIDVRAALLPAAHPLPVESLDKQTWEIAATGTVRLNYDVFWNDSPPFGSQLDSHHAFINLAEILFYAPERRSEATEVEFTGLAPGWKIAVELPAAAGADSYRAPGYDALVDAPVEIGDFDEFRLTVNGARLRVVVDGKAAGVEPVRTTDRAAPMNSIGTDEKTLAKSIRAIVGYETRLMREVPFDEYLFLYHFGRDEGGMEHANSTAIAVADESEAAAVTAHEFFHVWNVKRIRPQSLEPVDYAREQWTRALWFAEGVTSTYAGYTLVRTGLWSRQEYQQHLADLIGAVEARPARAWQSVEEASLDAWLEKYPWYFRPDRSISYYDKGELLGVLLDIRIRELTGNRKSLDDLMRFLNTHYAHQHRFYHGSADIEKAAETLTGQSFAPFFARYVSGSAEIPYDSFLRRAGLLLHSRAAVTPSMGFFAAPTPAGIAVAYVIPGSAAEKAGVQAGDAILKLDGEPVPDDLLAWLAAHSPGEPVTLLVRREGVALSFSFPLGSRPVTTYAVEEDPGATGAEQRIRDGLLAGKTD
jgi:predicted metalloprotease with PDZ domain